MATEDYVDYLSKQARSGASVFHEFRLLAANDGSIHSFYEGEHDTLYYGPAVRRFANGSRVQSYVCDGKDGVVYLHAAVVHHGYDKDEKCLFFIDRDYDDFFQGQPNVGDDVHITEHYSVENYLSSDEGADLLIREFCGFSDQDPEFATLQAALSNGRLNYRRAMLPFLAWALACREEGRLPNFQNVQLQKIFHIDASGCVHRKRSAFKVFRKACIGSEPSPPIGHVLRWTRTLAGMEAKLWMRGKFELWLFESVIIAAVGPAVVAAKARGKSRVRLPAMLSQRRSFDMLGGQISTAPSVEDYIQRRLAA